MMIPSKLPEFIYQGNDIPEILRLYEADLQKSTDFQSKAHASAIRSYYNMITDKRFLTVVRKSFDQIYQILEKDSCDLKFSIEGRRKSLVSSEEKICKLLYENRSLDLFRDIFAFRVIVFNGGYEKCYAVMNEIINFFVGTGFTLCEEDPVVDTMDTTSSEFHSISVPKESGILDAYLYGVKDYILHPKANGYQSLHCVFRTKMGYCIEVQVRSFDMHLHAEAGNAEHTAYKNKKYGNRIVILRNKVHIPGYGLSPNGRVFDFVGLEQPLTIISRQKTF